MKYPMPDTLPLDTVPTDAIEILLDAAFGADRKERTAYRLREGSIALPALSFAIMEKDRLIASIQCWPVRIGQTELVLVGPVAVDPHHQNSGHGRSLMHIALDAARDMGDPPMVMIGDPEYYGRFGFSADGTGGWSLPGPWDKRRLLARNVANHTLPAIGMLERADAL